MTAVPAEMGGLPTAAAHRARQSDVSLPGLLTVPGLFIAVMAVVPAFLLIQLSLAHREVGGLWSPGLELTHYAELATPLFARTVAFSLGLALTTAAITIAIAFPAAFFISRMRRKDQVAWLVYLLGALSLSEVLIVFAFQVLLSTSGGLAKAFAAVGLISAGESLYPNFPAVLLCLVYLVLPYVILFFYPAVSQLDEDVAHAASTMGSPPLRTFVGVTIPMMRGQIATAALLVVVFTVGAYVTPLVLGKPQTWTLAIHINTAAMSSGNIPLAAAQAVVVVAMMVLLLGLVRLAGGLKGAQS